MEHRFEVNAMKLASIALVSFFISAWTAPVILFAQEGMINPKAKAQTANQSQTEPASWKDSGTNLVWMRADNGQDLTFDAADTYCHALPHPGHSSWKMPSMQEMDDLFDSKQPTHIRSGFYTGSGTRFWVGPTYGILEFKPELTVHTYSSNTSGVEKFKARVLCVYSAENFTESTWHDPVTSLIWTHNPMGDAGGWSAANTYCRALVLDNLSGWSLPTIDQLASLYDPNEPKHVRGGISIHNAGYWSSTQGKNSKEKMLLGFDDGARSSELYEPQIIKNNDGSTSTSITMGDALCVHTAP
jgi:hypothetical protein